MHLTTAAIRPPAPPRGRSVRNRLRDQGFELHSEAQALALAPRLRWTTGICGALVLLGTILQYPPLLWAMAPLAFVGAAWGLHPFDWAHNRWLRGDGPEIPHYGSARRFTFGLATVWLIGTGVAFAVGATTLGSIMGLVQVTNAVSSTTIHILPPATIYSAVVPPAK